MLAGGRANASKMMAFEAGLSQRDDPRRVQRCNLGRKFARAGKGSGPARAGVVAARRPYRSRSATHFFKTLQYRNKEVSPRYVRP